MKFKPSEQSSVTLVEYSADEIKLQASCAENALLVVSNTYSRYWRCKVNGPAVKVLPAYGTFWAFPLAKGEAEVFSLIARHGRVCRVYSRCHFFVA